MLQVIIRLLIGLFPVSEMALVLFRRSKGLGATSRDERSVAMLWAMMGAGLGAALVLVPYHVAPLPLAAMVRDWLTVVFMASGMLVRWAAIRTLGRYFTVDVAIHSGHQVVSTGPYAWVRHPSYAGLLLLWLGVGIHFGSGLCLGVLLVPTVVAILRRIRTEEAALRQGLGAPYEAYCRNTKCLVPFLW